MTDVNALEGRRLKAVKRPKRSGRDAVRPSKRHERYQHIDALRAFAVMLVVVAHTNIGGIPGGSGVTIFFTISGFIITHLILSERVQTGGFRIGDFYARRAFKLAPPFVVIIAIPTLIYSFANEINWAAFLSQVLFVFNWVSIFDLTDLRILPGSSVVWSLSIEEQFYIVFALFWLFAARSASYMKVLTVVAAACAVLPLGLRFVYSFAGVDSGRIYAGTDTRIDAIAIGILVAVFYRKHSGRTSPGSTRPLELYRHSDVWLIAAIAVYVATLLIRDDIFRDTVRYSLQSLATAVVILFGFVDTPSMLRRVFNAVVGLRAIQIIGLASYSMYLIHDGLYKLLEPSLVGMPNAAGTIVLVLVGVVGGVLAWLLVEKPAERLKSVYFSWRTAEREKFALSRGSLL